MVEYAHMKTKTMTVMVAAVLLAGMAMADDPDADVPKFEYDGEIEIAAPLGNGWVDSPDRTEEISLQMTSVPKNIGSFFYRPKAAKTPTRGAPLPEGMIGMDATMCTLDDGRVAVAFLCPDDMDATTGFRMNVWIGPWASLKASSTRGFYCVSFNRPRGSGGTWLPKDLKVMDAKFRALAERRAKDDGKSDDPVMVDLTTDLSRFSTIHESEYYDAHASSIMLPDEKTMFCFWDLAHGGPTGPAAKSTDGGRTWTDISGQIPADFRKSHDAPVAFRFVDPKTGKARLRVFAGFVEVDPKDWRGPKDRPLVEAMPSIMSEDDGQTWKYLPPMGPDFCCVISFFGMERLQDGSYLGVYHRGPQANGDGNPLHILSSVSRDGGLTWEKPNLVARKEGYELCEPAVFYSPDQKELCMLIRENSGKHPSQMCFSKDEGKTWSAIQDAPLALWGHRHVVQKLHDGRYLVVFRDTKSFIGGTVIAWVGPYESIKDGTGRGGYRIKLFPNYGTAYDCGYQGMHLKKDGEIVINTYSMFRPWANATPSIVSMHFKIEEADALLAKAVEDRKAHWADQLAALDEAKKGVEPAKEALTRTAHPQKRIVPFADEVKSKTVTLLTKATVYGTVTKDAASNGLGQMPVLAKKEVNARDGLIDVGSITGTNLSNLAPWYAPAFTAYVKWEVESEKDGKRVLRILNDFYGTVFVNGGQLPSSYGPDGSRGMGAFLGNLSQGLRLTVNLKKGKNEIVLMTSPGSAGQWLCAAALEN